MAKKISKFKTGFGENVLKWLKSPRSPSAMIVEEPDPNPNPKAPLTPFRRQRSKVFYASDDCLEYPIGRGSNSLKIDDKSSKLMKSKQNCRSLPSCVITEEAEVLCSSDEEEVREVPTTREESSSATSWRCSGRSPTSSLRGSPSQRSQDSGYSDSGESNGVGQPEEKPTQSQVKYISTVYLGDSTTPQNVNECTQTSGGNASTSSSCEDTEGRVEQHGTQSQSDLSPGSKLNSYSVKRNYKLAKRRIKTNKKNATYDNGNDGIFSPTTNYSSMDETALQMEHKSLSCLSLPNTTKINKKLPTFKGLFSERRRSDSFQYIRTATNGPTTEVSRNLSIRQFRKVCHRKRLSNRCCSQERLSVSRQREEPLKARRRWSTADVERCSTPFGATLLNVSAPVVRLTGTPHSETTASHTCGSSLSVEALGNSSLKRWLLDLSYVYESECMNTLQSKSFQLSTPKAASIQTHLTNVQTMAQSVSAEFALLCQRLENLELGHVSPLIQSLVSSVEAFVRKYSEKKKTNTKNSLNHQLLVVDQICSRLKEICLLTCEEELEPSQGEGKTEKWPETREEEPEKEFQEVDPQPLGEGRKMKEEVDPQTIGEGRKRKEEVDPQPAVKSFEEIFTKVDGRLHREKIREFMQIVTALGHAFTKLVDLLLCKGLTQLVQLLEEETRDREIESAISELTTLGLEGGHTCKLVGRVGGIRALLALCLDSGRKKFRTISFRALATVCCVAESIDHFNKEEGIDVVADVLCDSNCSEEERTEAAGLLAQVTSPWVEDFHTLPLIQLHRHLGNIISSLTDLAGSTTSGEVFLLISAALANLTFLDGSCVDALLDSSTHRIFLRAMQGEDRLSIFTRDQIATVLASMSSVPRAAKEIALAGGIPALVKLLKTEPKEGFRLSEITALERVQQKSAIALSRLSSDHENASEILSLGGGTHLVHLCRNESARNRSDAVLVACLAALRKIATSCTSEELEGFDAQELIVPRLLDSFLIYSSQQESLV